jgi:hypothetical protein
MRLRQLWRGCLWLTGIVLVGELVRMLGLA